MSKFNPGDVVYIKDKPMCMYLALDDGDGGIMFTSFQEQAYDGTAEDLSYEISRLRLSPNLYPRLQDTTENDEEDFVFLTNISRVLVHLEIELQRLREEKEYEKVPF